MIKVFHISQMWGCHFNTVLYENFQQLLQDYLQHRKLNRCLSVCRIEACVSFATWNLPFLQWWQSQLLVCLKNYEKAIQRCDPNFAQSLILPLASIHLVIHLSKLICVEKVKKPGNMWKLRYLIPTCRNIQQIHQAVLLGNKFKTSKFYHVQIFNWVFSII